MKQEYHFTISRTDRICLIVFVLLLLSWELVKYIFPSKPADSEQMNIHEDGESEITTKTKFYKKENEQYYKNNYPKNTVRRFYDDDPPIENKSPVAIMEASVEEMRAIGLSGKVAYNIKKYISAGGMVRNDKELLKIYGMDSIQLAAASSYIIYPKKAADSMFVDSRASKKTTSSSASVIDLNQASVIELESLPGIGPVLAERIIKYRENLRGFHQVDQLKECYGLPPETFDKISASLVINAPPDLIAINTIDLSTFNHPYLNKRFPKMIKAYKDQHGPFMNASDLKKVYPPDSTWCEKILPYLSFQ